MRPCVVIYPFLFQSRELGAEEWPTRLTLMSTQATSEGTVWLRYQVLPAQGQEIPIK